MYALEFKRKDGSVLRFPLRKLPLLAGRSRSADLCIPHRSISRGHARLFMKQGELHVADLGSSNGTFVENVRIESMAPLRPGNELRLGSVSLRLVDFSKAEPGTSAVRSLGDPLRFHRIEIPFGKGVLAHDFFQYGGGVRLVILALLLLLAVGTFLVFRWVGASWVSDFIPDEARAYEVQEPAEGD